MMFMLDTDICIYLINERDEALRERFEANASGICISVITHADLPIRRCALGSRRREHPRD